MKKYNLQIFQLDFKLLNCTIANVYLWNFFQLIKEKEEREKQEAIAAERAMEAIIDTAKTLDPAASEGIKSLICYSMYLTKGLNNCIYAVLTRLCSAVEPIQISKGFIKTSSDTYYDQFFFQLLTNNQTHKHLCVPSKSCFPQTS